MANNIREAITTDTGRDMIYETFKPEMDRLKGSVKNSQQFTDALYDAWWRNFKNLGDDVWVSICEYLRENVERPSAYDVYRYLRENEGGQAKFPKREFSRIMDVVKRLDITPVQADQMILAKFGWLFALSSKKGYDLIPVNRVDEVIMFLEKWYKCHLYWTSREWMHPKMMENDTEYRIAFESIMSGKEEGIQF